MEKLVLKSVRFNAESLRKIHQLHNAEPYWKETSIINQLITTLVQCADRLTLHRMLNTSFPFDKGYEIKFDVNPDKIKERHQPNYDYEVNQ